MDNHTIEMFEVIENYFRQRMTLTEEDVLLIRKLLIPRHLEKGEFLIREGEVPKYGSFVCSGCLRSYVIDNKGKEHIVQFAPKNWWMSDSSAILKGSPSTYFMDAIEPSDILLIDYPSLQQLISDLPGYAAAFQIGLQKHAAAKDERIVAAMSSTAEERFRNFLTTYPGIAQTVPQHMLASYLGVTPETLSRIRKKWSAKKLILT
ncbi:MAG TPA: Crp/Fnr family transcriptional regulator [Flavitalea sp.]|nr:Crp/Fnr family transcriptional regulator [Flavitalea sp.]